MHQMRHSSPLWLCKATSVLHTLMIALILTMVVARPVMAQSILRDAETEKLFDDMSAPLIAAAGLDPKNVKVVLIGDKEINAFVTAGQAVYIHSGLIDAATSANEVQGVIAHELGHIAGGHAIRSSDGIKTATGISLLSLLVGVAAMAAGAGEAGAAVLAAGQQAALGKYLAFSRAQESSADAAGASYLGKAGISGRGSIAFFKKLQNLEFRLAIPQDDSYGRTHPLSGERIAVLEGWYLKDPAWQRPSDAAIEARFQRVKAKLKGYIDPRQALIDYPESNKTPAARYARAYGWHRSAYPDKALSEANALISAYPADPYFMELKGQILLESGRPTEALPLLRAATNATNAQPLIAAVFGHALIATEDTANFAEARRVLKAAVSRDNDNPFAWYQLGVVYDQEGDAPRASLATAERYSLEGRPQLALLSAETAMKGVPEGSADWIRAQDIAMVARASLETGKRGRRRRVTEAGGSTHVW
jgi:predicted Zn-dependent protease